MEPHQQRVVTEKAELDEKIDKLESFIAAPFFQTLHHDEQDRMKRQAVAMTEYSLILGERIAAF